MIILITGQFVAEGRWRSLDRPLVVSFQQLFFKRVCRVDVLTPIFGQVKEDKQNQYYSPRNISTYPTSHRGFIPKIYNFISINSLSFKPQLQYLSLSMLHIRHARVKIAENTKKVRYLEDEQRANNKMLEKSLKMKN